MEIKREVNNIFPEQYIYRLIEGNNELKIVFGGNLDLYISLLSRGEKEIHEGDSEEFLITKEYYAIYNLFEELHTKITTGRVFENDSKIFDLTHNFDEDKNIRLAIEKGLINEKDEIEWYCDDYPIKEGDSLKIIKEEEQFRLVFKRNSIKGKTKHDEYYVRICNSGSRYLPFNCCFMDLYNKLQTVDPDNYQMHIEEYIYRKRKK